MYNCHAWNNAANHPSSCSALCINVQIISRYILSLPCVREKKSCVKRIEPIVSLRYCEAKDVSAYDLYIYVKRLWCATPGALRRPNRTCDQWLGVLLVLAVIYS
jgi:hypothetical protein